MLRSFLVCLVLPLAAVDALAASSLFLASRPEALNLLNHPLQLQLATGELPLGSFRRIVTDRRVLLEGLNIASNGLLGDELARHDEYEVESWLNRAEEAGKTIEVADIKCFSCGGQHLNIDCPDDSGDPSQSALAMKSIVQANGFAGAAGVLRSYSFACSTMLRACALSGGGYDQVYHGWLKAHSDGWSGLADRCEEKLDLNSSSDSYSICSSMLYNWIDGEAATTGIRADLNHPKLASLLDALEELEPGYAAQRDKHQSFVADITGVASKENGKAKTEAKVNAAAADLAAKNKKTFAVDKAAAYLAAKKKKEQQG